MTITREKIDATKEKSIITMSITNTEFLRQIKDVCPPEYLKTSYARVVFGWCRDYFEEFGRAPTKDIQDIYLTNRSGIDDEDVDLIGTFLQNLSDNADTAPVDNVDYLVKQAIHYLNIRAAEVLRDAVKDAIADGDVLGVEDAVSRYKKIEAATTNAVDVLNDHQAVLDAFNEETQNLFKFFGAVGDLVGWVARSDLVAFLAFAKRGKSQWLQLCAHQAEIYGLRTLFISFEMPQKQMMRRFWRFIMGRPKYTKNIRVPYFFKDEESDERYQVGYRVEHREGIQDMALTEEDLRAMSLRRRQYYRGEIRLYCAPNKTMSVQDLTQLLNRFEYYDKWVPDVVVIDYADLMVSKEKDIRHRLDDIWSGLRSLASARNIGIITASQSGRASATADATEADIAEDIRKIAHVTKMITVNSSRKERAAGLARLSCLAEREDETIYDQVYVATCLDIGNPCLDSRFQREVIPVGKEIKGAQQ